MTLDRDSDNDDDYVGGEDGDDASLDEHGEHGTLAVGNVGEGEGDLAVGGGIKHADFFQIARCAV